jgi:hypothetical protein
MGPHRDYPGPQGHQGPSGLGRVYVTWHLPNHVEPQTTQVDIDLLPTFMGIVLAMGATITDVI